MESCSGCCSDCACPGEGNGVGGFCDGCCVCDCGGW